MDINKRLKQAFTIVELICILVIIGILVSILMPSLSKSRSSATRVICNTYLRMHALAGQMYLDENDGYFPNGPDEWLYSSRSISEEHPLGCRWHDRLMAAGSEIMEQNPNFRGKMQPYLDIDSIGPCPTFRRFSESRGCQSKDHNPDIDINPENSYSINGYLGSNRQGGVLKQSEIRSAGDVFFFAEENSWTVRPDHPKYPASWLTAPLSTTALNDSVLLITPTPKAEGCFATYHTAPKDDLNSGSGNVAFIDGHVETITVGEQLRAKMHNGSKSNRRRDKQTKSSGNLYWSWPSKTEPPGGWESQ